MRGPDHKNSLNTKEFKQFVKIIRESEDALGSGLKKPSLSEKNIFGMRRSLVLKEIYLRVKNLTRAWCVLND